MPIEVHNQARFQYVKEEAALATARFQVRQESLTGRNLKFPAKDASFHNVESVAPGNSQGVAFGPRVQFPAFIERKNLTRNHSRFERLTATLHGLDVLRERRSRRLLDRHDDGLLLFERHTAVKLRPNPGRFDP